jgi:hypothetical protein
MPKVIIVIEDTEDGRVRMVSNPSYADMAERAINGHDASAAEGYAMNMLRIFWSEQKERMKEKKLGVALPKLIV